MNSQSTSRIFRALQAGLLLALFLSTREGRTQSVIAPPPAVYVVPPAVQQAQQGEMDVFLPAGTVTLSNTPPLQLGPVAVRPYVLYRFVQGSGIPAAGSNHVSTTIQEISPGVLLGIGNHWTLDYTPTWRFYSSRDFNDTLDHNVQLVGGTTYNDWKLGLSQSYRSSSEPLAETGTQTDQETYLTTLTASYRLNSKMSTDLGINQNFTFTDKTSREWSTMDWLNYEFWPRLSAGGGLGLGYIDVSGTNSDMLYQQLQGRVGWRATDKISFQINGGVEIRQFLSGDQDDLVNPVAGAQIQYQPFEFTKLSASVERAVTTSVSVTNEVTETTGITIDLNQRLLKKLNLDLSGGYHLVNYVSADPATGDRRDDIYTFNARLGCVVLKRGNAAVFYQYSKNSSNRQGFSFVSNQVGFEVGYRF